MPSLGGSGRYGGDDPTGGYTGGSGTSAGGNKKTKREQIAQNWWDSLTLEEKIFYGFSSGGATMGPPGALLGAVVAGATEFADPAGSVAIPGTGASDYSSNRDSGGRDPIAPSLGPAPAPAPPEAPPPLLGPEPSFAEKEKLKRRKRTGRQQTIVAGRLGLSDDVYKPTLLGS
jgi:hypothetical protein